MPKAERRSRCPRVMSTRPRRRIWGSCQLQMGQGVPRRAGGPAELAVSFKLRTALQGLLNYHHHNGELSSLSPCVAGDIHDSVSGGLRGRGTLSQAQGTLVFH